MTSMGKISFFNRYGLIVKSVYYYSVVGRRVQIRDMVMDLKTPIEFYIIEPNVNVKAVKLTKRGNHPPEKIERPPAIYNNIPAYDYFNRANVPRVAKIL